MTKEQVLEDEILVRASRRQHGREQQPEEFEHVVSVADPRHARYCRLTPGSASSFINPDIAESHGGAIRAEFPDDVGAIPD
jgi:hypothetical protein